MALGGRSFLQRLFGGTPPTKDITRRPEAPPGATVYAIGDIHGRSDMLDNLLRKIAADAAEDEVRGVDAGRRELILLGDYVDRGPDSPGVIGAILSARNETDFWTVTALKGNHEFAFLSFLNDPAYWPIWADYGARETLLSYGVNPPNKVTDEDEWVRAHAEINAAVPPEHRAFLDGLELTAARGDYLCVHAGVRPDVPLDEQVEQDLLWIREDFLKNSRRLEKVVVHGHSPAAEVFLGEHRIGLDTGAYATSVLSAVKLRGAEQTLIQARGKE